MEDARRAAAKNGHGPVQELVRSGLVTDLDILRTTAAEAGVDLLEKIETVPEEAVKAVPRQLAYRLAVMPLHLEGRHLRVAVTDPFNFDAIDTLSKELRYEIDPIVAPAEQIELALKRHYGSASEMVHSLIGTYSGDKLQVKDESGRTESRNTRPGTMRTSSAWSISSSWKPTACAPVIFISNPWKNASACATASTACSRS